jgi:hypothetical protein
MSVGNITESEKMTLKTDTLPVVKDLQVTPSIVPQKWNNLNTGNNWN